MKLQKAKSVRGRLADNEPNPVDVHVGNRIRLRRTILGFSQTYLGSKLGLTFQQVQKYEKGENRVSASRLWDVSNVLKVSMDYFFEDMEQSVMLSSPMMLAAGTDAHADMKWTSKEDIDPMQKEETIKLVRAYYRINNSKVRKDLYSLLQHISLSNSLLKLNRENVKAEKSQEE